VGCVIAATSNEVNTLIGACAVIGIGNALHQTAWACLSEVVPKRSRSVASAFFETSLAVAQSFGPIIGKPSIP
jgi:predicted MFS family arabinose efflux permease